MSKFLAADLEPLPGCCGVNVVMSLNLDNDDGYYTYTKDDFIKAVATYTRELKRLGGMEYPYAPRNKRIKLFLCTITDRYKQEFRYMSCALRKAGWKLREKTPSKMGRRATYHVYLFARNFSR